MSNFTSAHEFNLQHVRRFFLYKITNTCPRGQWVNRAVTLLWDSITHLVMPSIRNFSARHTLLQIQRQQWHGPWNKHSIWYDNNFHITFIPNTPPDLLSGLQSKKSNTTTTILWKTQFKDRVNHWPLYHQNNQFVESIVPRIGMASLSLEYGTSVHKKIKSIICDSVNSLWPMTPYGDIDLGQLPLR